MPNPHQPDGAARALPRLYAILDVDAAAGRGIAPLALLEAWLSAGVRLVQLRAKSLTFGPFLDLASEAVALARPAGCLLIVNDRADVAALSGADGVHVGQDDLAVDEVRRVFAQAGRPIVGLSTHTIGQLTAATAQPIDYVASGPVFSTLTKTSPWTTLGVDGVRRAAAASDGLPLVAIGGITLATAADVIAAGAASVAVISDLLAGDPAVRAREYLRALA